MPDHIASTLLAVTYRARRSSMPFRPPLIIRVTRTISPVYFMQPLLEKNQAALRAAYSSCASSSGFLSQVHFQAVSAITIVIQTGNLDKSAATVIPAIAGGIVPHAFAVHQIGNRARWRSSGNGGSPAWRPSALACP